MPGIEAPASVEEQAVAEFIDDFWNWTERLSPESDIFRRLQMSGDDCSEFIEKFCEKFEVDFKDYRWYFHHGEEGQNFGGIFFKPPNARVARIPITPALLAESIKKKYWAIEYPPHELPPIRWDIRINQAVFYGSIALLIVWLVRRFVM